MQHPKQILEQYGLEPKKSLGQNFLYDLNILSRIVQAGNVEPQENVLEIGPGVGSLTEQLARAAGHVVAVELDDRLIQVLENELSVYENVTIVHGDILEQDPARWFGDAAYKVLANVPYYITGAILRHLLAGRGKPQRVVLTVQKEVAERITAQPGDMSLLAVSVQFFGHPEIAGEIKAGAFWPRPDVDSAILTIDLQDGPLLPLSEEEAFFRVVRAGFSQKRKQLQKNLRSLGYDRAATVHLLRQAGVEPRRRAETLSIEEWVNVYRLLSAA